MDAVAVRARGVGEILDGAFRLYREDLGLYALMAVIAAVPMALVMVLSLVGGNSTAAAITVLLLIPAALVAMVLVWAALVHLMNERLQGRQPALAGGARRALGVGHRVVWAGILAYLVMGGAMMLIMLASVFPGAFLAAFAGNVLGVVVGSVIAIALMLTVGLRVIAGSALFLPGIVVESLTGYGSLKRGFDLAKKGKGRVVTVLVVAWILIFVPMLATYFITGTTSLLLDPEAAAAGTIGMGRLAVQQLLLMIASGFTTPYFAACVLLLYYDQRVRLEAFDIEAEAQALAT